MQENSTARQVTQVLLKYGVYLLFVILCVILALTSKNFLSANNLINVLLQTSVIGIIAIGMTYVIIAQGIDVSVGSVVAICGGAGVGLIKLYGAPWWVGMLTMLVIGVAFGLLNGFATAYLRMPAFLVTLATMSIGRGLALVLSGGKSWFGLPPEFVFISSESILGIPLIIVIVFICYGIGFFVLRYTIYGRKVFAVGGNPTAARASGINVNRIILSTFVLSGLVAGVGAILQTARINSFWASMGTGFEFSAIAAVVIGGTSLSGGKGSLGGALVGVLIMGVINNALNLWGVDANMQEVARGLIIFIAVMLDSIRTRFIAAE